MDAALFISTIISAIAGILILMGLDKELRPLAIIGLIVLALDAFIGFGLVCTTALPLETDYLHPVEVLRSKTEVIVKTEGELLLRNNQFAFCSLKDDQIWVKRIRYINSYGTICNVTYKLTTKEK